MNQIIDKIPDDFIKIPNVEGYYINKEGIVISNRMKNRYFILTPYIRLGYLRYKIDNKSQPIHRLLAITFLDSNKNVIKNKLEVNHKDGNKLNNSIDNLEWITKRENIHHAMRTGLHDNPEVPVVSINKKTGEENIYISQIEASKQTVTHQTNISSCIRGLRNSAGGYYWKLMEKYNA